MNNNFVDFIIKFLTDNHYSIHTETLSAVEEKILPDDAGISSNGVVYRKNDLMRYIFSNNLPNEQYIIDRLAEQFKYSDSDFQTQTTEKLVDNNILQNTNNIDEIQAYLNLVILKELTELKEKLSVQFDPAMMHKEYKVISLTDNNVGYIRAQDLEHTLNLYARDGWVLKTVYTNELGKNGISIGNVGINSTQDQNILIFEKTVYNK